MQRSTLSRPRRWEQQLYSSGNQFNFRLSKHSRGPWVVIWSVMTWQIHRFDIFLLAFSLTDNKTILQTLPKWLLIETSYQVNFPGEGRVWREVLQRAWRGGWLWLQKIAYSRSIAHFIAAFNKHLSRALSLSCKYSEPFRHSLDRLCLCDTVGNMSFEHHLTLVFESFCRKWRTGWEISCDPSLYAFNTCIVWLVTLLK